MVGRRSFPFGFRPIFRCELLASGRLFPYIHPGKLTAGSPKSHPIQKEHHLNQTFILRVPCLNFGRFSSVETYAPSKKMDQQRIYLQVWEVSKKNKKWGGLKKQNSYC